jgi:ABC-type transport system involved in multi-copper enzyme maturation permease subunit
VWKDLDRPLFLTQGRAWLELGLWPLAAVLAVTIAALAKPATYGSFFFVILIVQGVFVLRLGLVATGAITREKEARTWPILLTAPLDDGAIVRGKARAALRRNLLFLAAVLVLYLLAFQFGRPGEQDLSHLLQIVGVPAAHLLGTTLFLIGGGLYAGVRCRTTTAALAWTLGIYFLSKLAFSVPLTISPGLLPGFLYTGNSENYVISVYATVFAVVYAFCGLFCLRAAARRLRRNVFG